MQGSIGFWAQKYRPQAITLLRSDSIRQSALFLLGKRAFFCFFPSSLPRVTSTVHGRLFRILIL